ncbi:hypothetical protein F4823DRAFT_616702 [Ustulina deusta]|nr:hypothetical protein F4823DRAFT_616702 [Ustulina deusta]
MLLFILFLFFPSLRTWSQYKQAELITSRGRETGYHTSKLMVITYLSLGTGCSIPLNSQPQTTLDSLNDWQLRARERERKKEKGKKK